MLGAAGRVLGAGAGPPDLKDFQVHRDFQIELFATEPVVVDPVDMAWDENGKIYVLEMEGYPTPPSNSHPFPGKIVTIEDTNGNGVCGKRTVFADDFRYADSILPYRGGLLVASTPDILFLKDENGDGVADKREVLFSGFTVGNAQHNVNGLTWGLDNWVYGSNGGNSGRVYVPGHENERVGLAEKDYRFSPDKKIFQATAESSGGFGFAFDEWGHIFTTHNTEHISHTVFPDRYLDRNPYLGWSGSTTSISDHNEGNLARIFPIGVPQTRMNHPEQSGYFSGSCGIAFYGGGAFPEPFNHGTILVGDVVVNLAHRDVIRPDGPIFVASRAPEEERREFLASSDSWFRPVNFKTGPDGALYVLDFHRAVIEHPEWIPAELQKNLDLRAGETQGRIYRITPRGGLPRVKPHFDRGNLEEVVQRLGSPNQWRRDTAQRLLVQWQDPASVPLIQKLFKESQNPLARLHAMYALDGLEKLENEIIFEALHDPEPGLRENAVKLAEPRLGHSNRLDLAVLASTSDPNARARMQAVLSLGEIYKSGQALSLDQLEVGLLKIADSEDVENAWMRMALLSGVADRPLPLLRSILERYQRRDDELGDGPKAFAQSLAEMIGARKDRGETGDLLALVSLNPSDRFPKPELLPPLLEGLADGLARGDTPAWMNEPQRELEESLRPILEESDPRTLRPAWKISNLLRLPPGPRQNDLIEKAAQAVQTDSAPVTERLNELALLEFAEFPRREEILFDLLNIRHPTEIQVAAMEQLKRGPNEKVAPRLLEMWKSLGPEVRRQAGNVLLYRKENQAMLLTALANKDVLIGQMNFDLERRRALLFSMNAEIRKRASKLFTDAGVATRAEAIDKMRPALKLKGDPQKGHEFWKKTCSKCHMIGKEGSDVGPNLTDIFHKSAETLLQDILDPNAALGTRDIGYTIVTKSGAILNGLLRAESPSSVTLREAEAKDTVIPRSEIKEMYASGLSLMPEELEKDMEQQTMADLLFFLQQPR